MLRVLLASGDREFAGYIEKALQKKYFVAVCNDGRELLDTVRDFDPDVMMVDARLPGADIFAVLRGVRNTFRNVGIVVTSPLLDKRTVNRFASLAVDQIVGKPCTVDNLVSHIVRVGTYVLNGESFDPRNEANSILLDLNFRLGTKQYHAACEAVLAYYAADKDAQMKDVYYQMMKCCGGTAQQKEKTLRDSIKAAAKRGDIRLWQMYFPPGTDGCWTCPTNEEFVARIAGCLEKRCRIKLPYQSNEDKAI